VCKSVCRVLRPSFVFFFARSCTINPHNHDCGRPRSGEVLEMELKSPIGKLFGDIHVTYFILTTSPTYRTDLLQVSRSNEIVLFLIELLANGVSSMCTHRGMSVFAPYSFIYCIFFFRKTVT
jgi:hypothetical protein